jgi:hypothetical protein
MNKWQFRLAKLRYETALFIHVLRKPSIAGKPELGKTREERNRNIELRVKAWFDKGPKPEHYGLEQRKPKT